MMPDSDIGHGTSGVVGWRATARTLCLAVVGGAIVTGCVSSAGPSTAPGREVATTQVAEWSHHVLAVFADEERDERLDEQRRLIGPGLPRFYQREIRYVEIVGDDPMRRALEATPKGFQVILVSKDGVQRLHSETVVSPERILSLIPEAPEAKAPPRK